MNKKSALSPILILFFFQLAMGQNGHYFYRDTFCSNQNILIVNQLFGPSNPTGQVTIPGGAASGADSVIHVELTFFQPAMSTLTGTFCEGDTVWVNGVPYHSKFFIGQETLQEAAANGCDSIVNINLTFRKVFYEYNLNVCEGDTVYFNGTAYHAFNTTGMEVIPNGACDSILVIKVNSITPPFSTLRDTLCPDEFYEINGVRYDYDNRNGFEILKNASYTGCDSIVTVELSFRNLWVYIGEDRQVIKGDTVCIFPQYARMPFLVEWLPFAPCSDPFCTDNCVQLINSTTFTYLATDSSGCVLRDDISFNVITKNNVYAPNVFSPDAEEPNNRFFLSCDRTILNIKQMQIADRWGSIIFDQKNFAPDFADSGWDGTYNGSAMNPGVYVFWAELERFDGSTFVEKGSFTLIR